jgi:hypothetical protein
MGVELLANGLKLLVNGFFLLRFGWGRMEIRV